MKVLQDFFGRPRDDGRPWTRRQRAWLLRGAALGTLLVCLSQWPRWSAWLQWWQREPLTTQAQQWLASDRVALAGQWAQHEASLDSMDAAAQHWRWLRERLVRQGLRVLQWQVLDGPVPAPGAWPLVVQRARLQLQGDAAAWLTISRSEVRHGALWRLDSLSGQAHAGEHGLPVWRWQAEWSLALRPAKGPHESAASDGKAGLATTPGYGFIAKSGSAQSPLHEDTMETVSPGSSMATVPDLQRSSVEVQSMRGDGLQITDWPLTQLQWVGLWRHGEVHEALFRAQNRLFRVRPGEAVGLEGHRWVTGNARHLVLEGPSAASATAFGAPSSESEVASVMPPVTDASRLRQATVDGSRTTTTILAWEGKP